MDHLIRAGPWAFGRIGRALRPLARSPPESAQITTGPATGPLTFLASSRTAHDQARQATRPAGCGPGYGQPRLRQGSGHHGDWAVRPGSTRATVPVASAGVAGRADTRVMTPPPQPSVTWTRSAAHWATARSTSTARPTASRSAWPTCSATAATSGPRCWTADRCYPSRSGSSARSTTSRPSAGSGCLLAATTAFIQAGRPARPAPWNAAPAPCPRSPCHSRHPEITR